MTDKQAVIDALGRLPKTPSLDEITEKLRIMAAIRRGRADIASGRSKSHEEVEQQVESWTTRMTAGPFSAQYSARRDRSTSGSTRA